MPLVIAPLGVLLVGLFLYAYLSSHSMTVKPQLDATADRKTSFLKTASFLYKASGLKWVLHVTHVTQAITSRFAVNHFPALTRWFGGHTARVQAQAKEFSHISNDTADALAYMRHHTVPLLIKAKVAPVKAIALGAEHTGDIALKRGRAEEKARRRSISATNKRLAGLAGLLLGADLFVFGRHALTHHRHHVRDIPKMRDHTIPKIRSDEAALAKRLAKQGARLTRLEKLLGGGLLAGLLVRTIARRWPWLFCRNWKKVGNRVCSMHSGLLNLLLGLGGAMFVFSELCRFIETVAVIAGRILPKMISVLAVAGAALCDGAHTAAPPLPLKTTTLPDVPNPLTIN